LVVLFWPFAAAAWRRGFRVPAAAGGIALAALVLTLESGSALAALLAGVAMFLLTALSARIGRFVVQAMIPVSVIVFPVFFAFWKRLGVGGDWLEYLPFSYQHRLAIWQFAADTISARPIFGWGLGTSRLVPGADAATEITVRSMNTDWVARYMGELMPLHPHNMVLQTILELGAIGGVMLAVVAWIGTGRIMRSTVDRVGLLTACAGLAALFTITLLSFGMGNFGFFVGVIYLTFAVKLAAEPETAPSKHPVGAQTKSAV
jgi:O-antigen ligase